MDIQRLTLGPLAANCWILTDKTAPGHALLIDPGGEADKILETLKERELKLDAILLTHGHFDHIAAVDEVAAATGAPLYCPQKDKRALSDPQSNLSSLFTRSPLYIETVPARLLKEWDVIPFGGERLTVLETPGHTPGSVCYMADGALFTGDTLFAQGCGRTDLPGGDKEALEDSLSRLLKLGDVAVYPGHGESTCILDERAYYETGKTGS